jgi:hypothetical protein
VDLGHRNPLTVHFDPHGHRVGPEGPDNAVMKAEYPVGIRKLAGYDLFELLGED